MPLIKHVYYCMSFHQSTHSAHQILCVFLSYEWVAPLRFYFTPCTYSMVLYGKMLQLLFYSFPPRSFMLSLIFRCKSHPTALHTFVFLASTVYRFPLSIPLHQHRGETSDDWDKIYNLSHHMPGSSVMWRIGCDLTALRTFWFKLFSYFCQCGHGEWILQIAVMEL